MPRFNLDTPELAEQYDVVSDKQYEHGKLLLNDLRVTRGERVLDVGSGTGRLAEYVATELLGAQGEVHGIDPLSLRVALARRRASPNHHVGVGHAEDLSRFADGTFDVVYLNSVYHWLPEKRQPLAEALRVLKPGGRIGISVASHDRPHDIQRVLQEVLAEHGLYREQGGATPHRVGFSELAAQLESAGFLIDQILLRSFGDRFPDADAIIDFNAASSFGNFLGEYLPTVRQTLIARLRERFEALRGADGIVAYRHLLFAVAHKLPA